MYVRYCSLERSTYPVAQILRHKRHLGDVLFFFFNALNFLVYSVVNDIYASGKQFANVYLLMIAVSRNLKELKT